MGQEPTGGAEPPGPVVSADPSDRPNSPAPSDPVIEDSPTALHSPNPEHMPEGTQPVDPAGTEVRRTGPRAAAGHRNTHCGNDHG
ncbi:hypothetical protein AB4212_33650, partial [Streptomyces sp. 2MCAF27]